jgi:hypothetical protein
VAAIDSRLYAEYAGTYELVPGTLVVVTNEAGHLMVRFGCDPREQGTQGVGQIPDRSNEGGRSA